MTRTGQLKSSVKAQEPNHKSPERLKARKMRARSSSNFNEKKRKKSVEK